MTNRRCNDGDVRTLNFPEQLRLSNGAGTTSPEDAISSTTSATRSSKPVIPVAGILSDEIVKGFHNDAPSFRGLGGFPRDEGTVLWRNFMVVR